MRTPHRITSVTTLHFTIPPQIPLHFQHVNQTLSIDRIRYWIEPAQYPRLRPHLGPVVKSERTPDRNVFTHRIQSLSKDVYTSISRRRRFAKFLLDVDDPTETDQKVLLELFQSYLMPDGYGLSEVEIALDLQLDRLEQLPLLKKWVLGHFWLPYARRSPRMSPGENGVDGTWYIGSLRGGPRTAKVYEKRLGKDELSDILRLEVTLHGRFDVYDIPKCDVIRLESVRLEKLFQWRRFDVQRAAELAYQRTTGRPMRFLRRRDPWIDVTLAHYRNFIEAELSPEQGADHIEVLGQLMDRCRKQDWWQPQDMAEVFPPLVPAASPGDEF